jgi:YebC/PmpR family DNA-binding regulatory protein
VERAIQRGAGGNEADNVEELAYEGYGPGGVAILVEAMTDNRNRTVAEVRNAFNKHGGNLGTDGSVAYLFARKGTISFAPGADEDSIIEAALEAGAEDVETHEDESIDVVTTPEVFSDVKAALEARGLEPDASEVAMVPDLYSEVDAETSETVLKLIDVLEDLDDVQNVYTNGSFAEEAYAGI